MPKAQTFAPWHIVDDLHLNVTKFRNVDTNDPMPVVMTELGDGSVHRAYDLGRHSWNRVEIHVTLEFSHDQRRDVLPPGEDANAALKPLVSIRCSRTKLRLARTLEQASEQKWEGSFVLERDALLGVARIKPMIVRTKRRTRSGHRGFARELGAIVAEGPASDLRIDESASPFEGGLYVAWEDFATSNDPFRRAHPDLLYDVDVDWSEPRLMLNKAFDDVHVLLQDERPTSSVAKSTRAAILAHVGSAALGHLFHAAATDVFDDEESGERTVPDGWQEVVLRRLVPHLYPEHSSQHGRMNALFDDLSTPDGRRSLERRLASALQSDQLDAKVIRAIMVGAGS